MTAVAAVPHTPVVGDGTTARTRASRRWRRARGPLAVLALVLVATAVLLLPAPRSSLTPLAPDNARPEGARAAARILEDQGVDVRYTRRIAEATSLASADATLLVVGDVALGEQMVDRLRETSADLVLVDAGWALGRLTDGAVEGSSSGGVVTSRDAACDDPDAAAAGTVTVSGSLVVRGDATACFPGSQADGGAYVVLDGERRVVGLSGAEPLRNDHLATEGNAALVLRTLGHHERLVWYIPSVDDLGTGGGASGPSASDVLPPRVLTVGLMLLVVVAVAALWRGRRMGRLVTEPLPVVVRAGETTRGRGRLYRRARAHGHAAAALRAGAAGRCAQRLGVPRSADAPTLVDAVSRATGRSHADVEQLLYGPPPRDDTGLTRLALDLDTLESEVHRS